MSKHKGVVIQRFLAVLTLLCGGLAASAQTSEIQALRLTLNKLSPEILGNLGLHLPSYIPSLHDQLVYQSQVPLHQELRVNWPKPSSTEPSTAPVLVIAQRWQHMPNSANLGQVKPEDHLLLAVAATNDGEIRAFALCVDRRASTSQLDLQFPQDGQIDRIVFFALVDGGESAYIAQVSLHKSEKSSVAGPEHAVTLGISK